MVKKKKPRSWRLTRNLNIKLNSHKINRKYETNSKWYGNLIQKFQIHLSSRNRNWGRGVEAIFNEMRKSVPKLGIKEGVVRIWKSENYKLQHTWAHSCKIQKIKGWEIPKICQREKSEPLWRDENRLASAISLGNHKAHLHSRWQFLSGTTQMLAWELKGQPGCFTSPQCEDRMVTSNTCRISLATAPSSRLFFSYQNISWSIRVLPPSFRLSQHQVSFPKKKICSLALHTLHLHWPWCSSSYCKVRPGSVPNWSPYIEDRDRKVERRRPLQFGWWRF